MSYCIVEPKTVIVVDNHKNLLAAWKMYGHTGLVAEFKCTAALSERQLGRLPADLRGRLVHG